MQTVVTNLQHGVYETDITLQWLIQHSGSRKH